MTVNATAGATQTQEQSTINDWRSDLAALIHRRRDAAIAVARMGPAPGPLAPAVLAGRLRTKTSATSPASNTPAAAGEPSSAQAPGKALLQAMGASAQQRGEALGRSLLQAVSLAQSSDLEASIWGQGTSKGSALKGEERAAWLHRVMETLSQGQALMPSDEAEIARSLYLRPGNEAISVEDVRAGILAIVARHRDDPERAALEVLRGALVHGLDAQQVAQAQVFKAEDIDQFVQSLYTFIKIEDWRAMINRAIATVARQKLESEGLTGAGVGVRVLEVENWGPHPQAVSGLINDPLFGIAPGAHIELDAMYSDAYPQPVMGVMLREETKKTGLSNKNPQAWVMGLRNTLIGAVSGSLQDASREVREFAYQSGARVMNMSFGSSLASYYNLVDRMLIFYPELHEGFYAGQPRDLSRGQQLAQIVDFVNQTVLTSDVVLNAYDDYVHATAEAVGANKTVVVAAGNWQRMKQSIDDQGVAMPAWAALNVMGMSPHVITVGASAANGTPEDLMDDTIAPFSSHGGDHFGVTLATQGVEAAVSYRQFFDLDWNANGTSFAAPLAAGTIALMLQRNPNLTSHQIRDILRSVAVDTPEPEVAEGVGMLDVVAAVMAEPA